MDVNDQERGSHTQSECIKKKNEFGLFSIVSVAFYFESIPSFWNEVCTFYWLNTTRMFKVCSFCVGMHQFDHLFFGGFYFVLEAAAFHLFDVSMLMVL